MDSPSAWSTLLKPLLFSSLAGLSTAVGGGAVFFVAEPSSKAMAFVLALAAGGTGLGS